MLSRRSTQTLFILYRPESKHQMWKVYSWVGGWQEKNCLAFSPPDICLLQHVSSKLCSSLWKGDMVTLYSFSCKGKAAHRGRLLSRKNGRKGKDQRVLCSLPPRFFLAGKKNAHTTKPKSDFFFPQGLSEALIWRLDLRWFDWHSKSKWLSALEQRFTLNCQIRLDIFFKNNNNTELIFWSQAMQFKWSSSPGIPVFGTMQGLNPEGNSAQINYFLKWSACLLSIQDSDCKHFHLILKLYLYSSLFSSLLILFFLSHYGF